jgi:spermidine synthase
MLLSIPLLGFAYMHRGSLSPRLRGPSGAIAAALLVCSIAVSVSYEIPCAPSVGQCEVRRDYAATVVARGEGMQRDLVVNGVGITVLSPITKYMAHLPLAFHQGPVHSTLVICFGMGTSYRSLLSLNVRATAVELVPSVRDSFGYFHADAAQIMANPRGHVVIDDGRRFLERTQEAYDVIVVDPPPPVPAAGSSLLYSREFHEEVRRHLKPGGIFQTWWPAGEELALRAIAQSLHDVFPYVKVYRSVDGWGLHFLASMTPIPDLSADQLLARIPASARADLTEWTPRDVKKDLEAVLESELPIATVLPVHASTTITDDRPFNEYYLVRRTMRGG